MDDFRGRIPGAGGVLLRDDEVLVITEISTNRAYSKVAGMLGAPMGLIEPEEEPARAAEREFLEEAGMSVRATHFLGCYRVGTADVQMFLMAKNEGGRVRSPQGSLNRQWMSIETLLRAENIRPPTKDAVKRAIALRAATEVTAQVSKGDL